MIIRGTYIVYIYICNHIFFIGSLCCGEAISRLRREEICRTSGETVSRSCPGLQTCGPLYVQG